MGTKVTDSVVCVWGDNYYVVSHLSRSTLLCTGSRAGKPAPPVCMVLSKKLSKVFTVNLKVSSIFSDVLTARWQPAIIWSQNKLKVKKEQNKPGKTQRKMDQLQPPGKLVTEGNAAGNWRDWKQGSEVYSILSGADGKDEWLQAALFHHVTGEGAREELNTFQ